LEHSIIGGHYYSRLPNLSRPSVTNQALKIHDVTAVHAQSRRGTGAVVWTPSVSTPLAFSLNDDLLPLLDLDRRLPVLSGVDLEGVGTSNQLIEVFLEGLGVGEIPVPRRDLDRGAQVYGKLPLKPDEPRLVVGVQLGLGGGVSLDGRTAGAGRRWLDGQGRAECEKGRF